MCVEQLSGAPTNSIDALVRYSFLKAVLPGSFMRTAFLVSALFWVVLLSLAPISRAQDNSGGEKKHYLTFQVSYFGSAQRSHQDEFSRSESSIEVNDRFSGRIEMRPTQAYDLPTSVAAQTARMQAMQAAMAAGDVKAMKAATPPLLFTWFPVGSAVEITGAILEKKRTSSSNSEFGESRAKSDTAMESYTGQKVFMANFGNAFIKIHPEEQRYDLQFSIMPDMAATWEAVHQTLVSDHKEEGHDRHTGSEAEVPLDMGPNQIGLGYSNYQIAAEVKRQPLAGEANELIGATRIPIPKPAGWDGSWDIAMLVSWQIDITLPPLELVITAPGYDEWRPEGNIKKPTEPGNKLVARATLKPKDGSSGGGFAPKIKSIRFQLLDTSREPGVCLNWPLEAKDSDYDLRLAAVAGGELSKSDQILEVTDPRKNDEGQFYAETQIDSYDFGGRTSLRAVCLLNDGRVIEGVMKDVGEMPRLPKMKNPGWIADSWRKAHQAEKLADDDDNEEIKGQKDNGDGFTLYEEYRGWVVKGKRIEGDPEGKDFFVLNLIGGDANGGIDLFEQLSELKVHAKLKRSEMSEKTRLMNGNRSEGPHNKDQHGVWVKQFVDDPKGMKDGKTGEQKLGNSGALTKLTKAGVAGRPGIVEGIGILARDSTGSDFSKPFNLPAQDAIFTWDRAIAHELFHSVGVEHHGPDDTKGYSLSFVPPNVPDNTVGRPHFRMGESTVVNLLEENGHDRATQIYPEYLQTRALMMASGFGALMESLYGKTPQGKPIKAFVDEYIDRMLRGGYGTSGMVGQEHYSHSGDQDCVMRYYFAKFYDAKNTKEKTVYLVTPGTERIGMEICRSGKGSGANAPNPPNLPQSRYGDTAPGAGNCFEQICPNDAIPPRAVK